MKKVLTLALTLSVILPAVVGGQEKKTTDVNIQGHVYEPAKLEPSDELVARLRLPEGFRVQKFAELQNPRILAVGPDGSVYVSQREPGTVAMLKDTDGDGVADVQRVVAEKEMIHGLAVHEGKMYLAAVKEVFVADIKPDGTLGPLQTIIKDLPDGGQHPNRTLAVGPDRLLYITSGSTCNECRETNPESATIVRATLDGRTRKVFASGLRNTIGFGWHPVSKKLYGMDHGIDWLGDDDQREELNELVEGAKYGWPYVYADSKLNPHNEPPKKLGLTNADWARQSKEPLLLYTAHSAPMQMAFYTGGMFPAVYAGDAFVAMRGSWNRKPPSGYEVVRVRFDASGKPTAIEPFLTGFLVPNGAPDGKDGQFARLAGVAVARDGALLVSDDTNNTIYRVSYGAQPRGSMAARQTITSMLPEANRAQSSIAVRSEAFGIEPAHPRGQLRLRARPFARALVVGRARGREVRRVDDGRPGRVGAEAVRTLARRQPPRERDKPARVFAEDREFDASGGGDAGRESHGQARLLRPAPALGRAAASLPFSGLRARRGAHVAQRLQPARAHRSHARSRAGEGRVGRHVPTQTLNDVGRRERKGETYAETRSRRYARAAHNTIGLCGDEARSTQSRDRRSASGSAWRPRRKREEHSGGGACGRKRQGRERRHAAHHSRPRGPRRRGASPPRRAGRPEREERRGPDRSLFSRRGRTRRSHTPTQAGGCVAVTHAGDGQTSDPTSRRIGCDDERSRVGLAAIVGPRALQVALGGVFELLVPLDERHLHAALLLRLAHQLDL